MISMSNFAKEGNEFFTYLLYKRIMLFIYLIIRTNLKTPLAESTYSSLNKNILWMVHGQFACSDAHDNKPQQLNI